MKKILFVCLGNICRSPMAEFIFRDMAARQGLSGRIVCASAATSGEEVGNPVYPPPGRSWPTWAFPPRGSALPN